MMFKLAARQAKEAKTSKCSFLDLETIQKHKTYAGKRVRKAVLDAFADGIEGVAVRPFWLRLDKANKSCA